MLQERFEFVLTERFSQDPIEQYFGNQKQLGRRSDNPGLQMFGYNDNMTRIQKVISCTSGNTRGRYSKRKNWTNITNIPLPKRKNKGKMFMFYVKADFHLIKKFKQRAKTISLILELEVMCILKLM